MRIERPNIAKNKQHEVITSLKEYYLNYKTLNNLVLQNVPITSSFINLAILKKEVFEEKEKQLKEGAEEERGKAAKVRDERLETYESIHEEKETIEVKQLFNNIEGREIKKIAIYGTPGIGKSTLCQYASVMWSKNQLWNDKFSAVIWLPLRKIAISINRQYSNTPSVSEIIRDYCMGGDNDSKPDLISIKQFVINNSKNTLFILDGYDEIISLVATAEGSRITQLLTQILTNTNNIVIITSRPTCRIRQIEGTPVNIDEELQNIGFTSENIKNYINKFMSPYKSKEIISFLESNKGIWGITHIPINLELICYAWEDLSRDKSYTSSRLYKEISGKLLKRYLVKEKNKQFFREEAEEIGLNEWDECKELVLKLEELAIEGMRKNEIVISKEVVLQVLGRHIGEILKIGIIKSIGEEVHFIHLTFQEYFAARYIARSIEEVGSERYAEAERLIREHKYTPYYEVMWGYVARVLYEKGKTLNDYSALLRFWYFIETEPREIIGFKHVSLLIRCLEECEVDESIEVHREIIGNITKQFSNIDILKHSVNILSSTYKVNNKLINAFLAIILREYLNGKCSDNKIYQAFEKYPFINQYQKLEEIVNFLLISNKGELYDMRALNVIGIILPKLNKPELIEKIKKYLLAFTEDMNLSGYSKEYRILILSSLSKLVIKLQNGNLAETIINLIFNELKVNSEDEAQVTHKIIRLLEIIVKSTKNTELAKKVIGELSKFLLTKAAFSASSIICILCELLDKEQNLSLMKQITDQLRQELDNYNTKDYSIKIRYVSALKGIAYFTHEPKILTIIATEITLALNDRNMGMTDEWIKEGAVDALEKMLVRAKKPEMISAIANGILSASKQIEGGVGEVLANIIIGQQSYQLPEAIKIIIESLTSPDIETNDNVIKELVKISGIQKQNLLETIVEKLLTRLSYTHLSIEHSILKILLSMQGSKPIENAVLKLLNENKLDYRWEWHHNSASSLLSDLINKRPLPALIDKVVGFLLEKLKEGVKQYIRSSAIEALGFLGNTIENHNLVLFNKTISELVAKLGSNEEWFRLTAAGALTNIRAIYKESNYDLLKRVVEELLELTSSNDRHIKIMVVLILRSLGTKLKQPELLKPIYQYLFKPKQSENHKVIFFIERTINTIVSNRQENELVETLLTEFLESARSGNVQIKKRLQSALEILIIGREADIAYAITRNFLLNSDIIFLNNEEAFRLVNIYCYKYSSNPAWIDNTFDHALKHKTYLVFDKETLVIRSTKGTTHIPLSLEQKKVLIEALKESAKTAQLPTEVYDYYLGQGTLRLKNITLTNEKTELHDAAERGDLEAVQAILAHRRIYINDQNNEGRDTPLMLAAINHHIAVVKYLVANGADVTCLNKNNDDALNISLFIKPNMLQGRILLDKYFVTEQRLRKILERGMVSYTGRLNDETVANIIYEITGNEKLINWKNDIGLRRTYRMYLENIIKIRPEHQRTIRVEGGHSDEILGIRLYLYIELYLKLQKGLEVEIPDREAGSKLFKEIMTIIDTLIGEKINNYWISSTYKEVLIKQRAKAIINKLLSLSIGEEYVIRTGYSEHEVEGLNGRAVVKPGHCLYISLAKFSEDRIIARVDNRWIEAGRIDGVAHSRYTKLEGGMRKIKSYYIGSFKLEEDKQELTQYIIGVIQAIFSRPENIENGLSNIYGIELPEHIKNISNDALNYIETWPYHTIQSNDNGNCTLSSYNLGISVRHGLEFFEWLLNYELREAAVGNQRAVNSSISVDNRENLRRIGRASGGSSISWSETIASNKESEAKASAETGKTDQINLSHNELMRKFQKVLKVSWDDIYNGIAVEQAMVSMAGINTIQTDTQYRTNTSNQPITTTFSLKFNNVAELNRFVNYFNSRFPGLIMQEEFKYQADQLSDIRMNTRRLYEQVAKWLERYNTRGDNQQLSRHIS
ncbi:NACHT domain-containing protein [Candidatus Jidaibacter acanthamoebae]|nr:NACHT domain-containing protein [Candidatus Jidaibacter acanthamoeba]